MGQRGKGFSYAHKVKTCVAECGNRVEYCIPDSLNKAEILNKLRRHQDSARQLNDKRTFEDKACKTDDPSYLGCRNSILHGTSFPQADFFSRHHSHSHSHSHYAHTADLNQRNDHKLAKFRPVGRSIMYDQPCNTYGRCRGKQRV